MSTDEPVKIGDIIDIYCSRCRLNLDGSVAALQGEEVVQATCRTCNTTQKYRTPVDEGMKRARMLRKAFAIRDKRKSMEAAAQPPVPAGESVTDRWRVLTADVDSRFAAMYRSTGTYRLEDVIIHPKHGLGIVTQVLHENAFLGLFREVEVPLEMGQNLD